MTTTRIIETAINENGDSYIFSDRAQSGWDLAGHTITELFFSQQNPPDMLTSAAELHDRNFNLKPGQLRFFRSDISPTRQLYDKIPENEKPKDLKELFYHSTTTMDFIMVAKGELSLIVGGQEVFVKAGDVVVQRGAAHAWHNYTNEDATIVGIMIGVELPKQFKRIDTVQP